MLEIRYTLNKGGRTLTLPEFLDDPAVQEVYLCAFVPPTRDVVGTGGSWAEDFQWRLGNQDRWTPFNSTSHEKKVEWVCEGNGTALDAAKTFAVDGTPLIFSTLRPTAQNNVRLWTVDHQALGAWIFGAVLLGGVLLVPVRLGHRLLAVAGLAVALVTLGVFWPTLSLHVLGGPLMAAAAIVLLVWVAVGLVRLYSPLMTFGTAPGAAWSARVAGRKAMAQEALGARPEDKPAADQGGANHE